MAVAEPTLVPARRQKLLTARAADIVTICCIVLALWLVYFRAIPYIGLYNDDYYNVGFPASLSFSEVWNQCVSWMLHWPNGRPLSACLGWMAAYVLVHIGGLHAIYLLPFTLVAVNSYLIYYLVSRRTSPLTGFMAAIAFGISPVDTLRLQYTVTFQYQACIVVTLAAFVLYERGKHGLAYLTLFCSLLFHECAVLGFLAAPILVVPWRRMPRELARNAIIVGCIIAAVLFARAAMMNESRTQSAMTNAGTMLRRSLESATTGTATHIQLLESRAIQSLTRPLLPQLSGTLLGLLVLLGCAMILIAGSVRFAAGVNVKEVLSALKREDRPPPEFWMGCARVFAAGLIIFFFNYLVFFLDPYHPANHIAGMVGLVHTAPGIGAAFCIAVIGASLIAGLGMLELRFIGLAVMLIFLSALGAWGSVIRGQYEQAWTNEQLFWKNVTTLVPDASDGTIIIVEVARPFDLPYTWVIGSNSWADTIATRMVYRCSWNNPPRLYLLPPSWGDRVQNRNGELDWMVPQTLGLAGWEPLPQGNVVVLQANNGVLTRLPGPLSMPQGELRLKPPPAPGVRASLSDGIVRRYLLPAESHR
jgi:hypothetical protein